MAGRGKNAASQQGEPRFVRRSLGEGGKATKFAKGAKAGRRRRWRQAAEAHSAIHALGEGNGQRATGNGLGSRIRRKYRARTSTRTIPGGIRHLFTCSTALLLSAGPACRSPRFGARQAYSAEAALAAKAGSSFGCEGWMGPSATLRVNNGLGSRIRSERRENGPKLPGSRRVHGGAERRNASGGFRLGLPRIGTSCGTPDTLDTDPH